MENQNQSTFVGKGKQKESGRIVVTLNMTEAKKFFSKYQKKQYLTVHIAELKAPDNFGRTHTAFCYSPTKENPEAQA